MSERDWHVRAPLPARVEVGPYTWTVTEAQDQGGDCLNPREGRIVLDERAPVAMRRGHLLHEVLHAILWAHYVVDPADDEAAEREEQLVARLEAPLLQVLRDNPLLVNYLTDQPHTRSLP